MNKRKINDNQIYWFIALIMTFVIGMPIPIIMIAIFKWDKEIFIPLNFTIIPLFGIFVFIRGKLFRKSFRYFYHSIYIAGLMFILLIVTLTIYGTIFIQNLI